MRQNKTDSDSFVIKQLFNLLNSAIHVVMLPQKKNSVQKHWQCLEFILVNFFK